MNTIDRHALSNARYACNERNERYAYIHSNITTFTLLGRHSCALFKC